MKNTAWRGERGMGGGGGGIYKHAHIHRDSWRGSNYVPAVGQRNMTVTGEE